jgi:glycosyltransferase involved in cell wall biosynthesis
MRILHVGYGFRPWLVNGLLIYSEAVMEGQARRGHEVAYFFPGRRTPLFRRPFLHSWERGGVRMFEWINSSLIVGRHRGTAHPGDELDHEQSEAAFREVLRRTRPQLVHFHDLGGLPSSTLEIARAEGSASVLTIHDYHLLCPTVKLYDARDQICMRHQPGAMCAVCCADAPDDNSEELWRTLEYTRRRLRSAIPPLDVALRRPAGRRLNTAISRVIDRAAGIRPDPTTNGGPGPGALERPPRASASAYQRRRDVNVARLNWLDALIASSRRSAEIYRQLGVTVPPIELVPINPPHLEKLRPRRSFEPSVPLRFVALNACASTQKGAELIVGALAELSRRGLDGRYRLSVYGPVAPHVQYALAEHRSVDLHGRYGPDELDRLLDGADVGLFPSIWEEVYGFVALEFLAKGLPVIGNAIGAIPNQVRPGETGWLNRSLSPHEMADLMAHAIENPGQVEQLSRSVTALRDELIEPFHSGLARLETAYEQALAARGGG